MTEAILLVLGGLVLLSVGGEVMVRGAYALSIRLRLTPAVIGLTVMAVGTSLPEMMTSVLAQINNSPDMSLGNIVGSNIFNIGAVLGVCGLLQALTIPGNTVRLEWPFMFLSSFILLLLARDGKLDGLEGGFFLVAFVLFTAYMVRLARIEVGREEAENFKEAVEDVTGQPSAKQPLLRPLALVVAGGVALWFGADLLISGAKTIAEYFEVPERIIAVTIVAAGTGLPEFVATLVAVIHKKTDMAVGNVIGSNIANVLLIGGVSASIKPLDVNSEIIRSDLWWLIGITFLLGPLLRSNRLSRFEALALFAAYVAYIVLLFTR